MLSGLTHKKPKVDYNSRPISYESSSALREAAVTKLMTVLPSRLSYQSGLMREPCTPPADFANSVCGYTKEEVNALPALVQEFIKTYECWHEGVGLYKLCCDNMRHSNHSDFLNLSSAGGAFGDDIAASDLNAGVELTVDYRVICYDTRITGKL